MHPQEIDVDALHLTADQQDLVRETVRSLLESSLFRRSKRYPAFLEFVVLNTLAGNAHLLKERVVADEVFGRSHDYDPSSDPVVRYTAGEVRKRLALYFGDHPEAPVRIDLPLGGYTAEFHFRSSTAQHTGEEFPVHEFPDSAATLAPISPAPVSQHPVGQHSASQSTARQARPSASRRSIWLVASSLVAVLLVAAWAVARWGYADKRPEREFWWPVLHNESPAVVVVGEGAYPSLDRSPSPQSSPPAASPPPSQSDQSGDTVLDEGRLVLGNALAVSQVCNTFRRYGRDCRIIPVQSVSFPEIHNSSIVLVGAFDNPLTIRFLSTLRYQLRSESSHADGVLVSRTIVDQSQQGKNSKWTLGQDRPSGDSGADYAILARFHSDINDGMVVVIAGLGPQGTHSAGDYVCSANADTMRDIVAQAPKSWGGVNFEAVLQIDLMRGNPGHVRVVATQYW